MPKSNEIKGVIPPYQLESGEEYMNDKQRTHFENILQAWKRELLDEISRTMTRIQDDSANYPDPTDRATQESEMSLELRTRDRERKLVNKIDKVLTLVHDEDYGYCNSCGSEIGIRRLEARPTAELCIECKSIEEIKEKQKQK